MDLDRLSDLPTEYVSGALIGSLDGHDIEEWALVAPAASKCTGSVRPLDPNIALVAAKP